MRYHNGYQAAIYQIFGTNSPARTISSPLLHPNAFANVSEFDSGPFTRHVSGECGSVVTRVLSDSSLSCPRNVCAYAMK